MHLEVLSHRPTGAAHPTPLLFVHGAWHGAWCWDEHFLPYFAERGYEAHALSLRGHGRSAGRVRWASAVDYVNDLEQVARSFDRLPVLIGHSLGGYVVQKYLAGRRAPGGVLLASVPVNGILRYLLRYAAQHPAATLQSFIRLNPYWMVATPELSRAAFFSPDTPNTAAYHDRLQAESFRVALDAALLDLPEPLRVTAPLLVLAATRDAVFTRAEQEATAAAYRVPLEWFDMAHDMMLEPGWQAVADRILAWLDEQQF